MRWRELISTAAITSSGGSSDPEIRDVVYDSRKVSSGAVYVAVPGFKARGDTFIGDAVRRGAVAVVSGSPQPSCPVPWAQVDDPRAAAGELARRLWAPPLDAMTIIGVTGTNGKTTMVYLFHQLLADLYGRDAAWMLSTVVYRLGAQERPADHTTPESSDVFRLIGLSAVKPRGLVMEVSSHSLALHRIAGLAYDVAVFSNLTQDHLDFHSAMDAYYQAKKLLFTRYLKQGGTAVINLDDEYGRRLVKETEGVRCITYGQADDAAVRIVDWNCDRNGTAAHLLIDGKTHRIASKLVGAFNVYNMTAVCAGAVALRMDMERVCGLLGGFEPAPGRMEKVAVNAPFSVIVDYAHTPDALDNVLATARALATGRLICVFGCGGDRDRTKRPRMAQAVVRHCHEAIVTSDNPRTEKPEAIIAEIMQGVPLDFPHWVIADRRAAIARALSIARPEDCVVIAGKGHEDYQEINGVRHHFSDREVVAEEYSRLTMGKARQ